MSIDLGDTVTLAWADAGASATLRVTLPDMSVAGPFTVTTGQYQFTTTQPGRHLATWVTSGPNPQVFTDVFEVDPPDAGALISLDDIKKHLLITQSTQDEKLRTYIAAASEVVEFYRGDLIRRTYTEVHNGGDVSIYLRHTPVLTITSMTEVAGPIPYTLTSQPPGSSVDSWGYSLDDPAAGRVVRRGATGTPRCFWDGVGNISVTYTTGTAVIPATVLLAVRIIIQHLWTNQRGAMPTPAQPGSGEAEVPGINFAVPIEAIELLETASRNPVIS